MHSVGYFADDLFSLQQLWEKYGANSANHLNNAKKEEAEGDIVLFFSD